MYLLSDEFVRIGFDEATGAIREFTNLQTGYSIIQEPDLALGLFLLIPIENQRNNAARSEDQTLNRFEPDADGKSAFLCFDRITADKTGVLDISVKVKVVLADGQVQFTVTVENRSAYTVEEVRYPCLGGIAQPEGETPLVSKTLQFAGGFSNIPLADGFGNPDYWGSDWPTHYVNYPTPSVSAPFLLLCGEKQGLYIGAHCEEPEFACFVHEYKPGYSDSKHARLLRSQEMPGVAAGFCISLSQLPFIAPGETRTLYPVAVEFFAGDWHNGIRIYQRWRKTWFSPVKRPDWLREADCWMTLHINSPEGCCRYRYTELPDIMREAKKDGVQVLQLIGWARGGQDGDEPYQDTDPLLGTKEELKEAIRQIQEMGIRVLPMCKFKWADQSTKEYKEELESLTIKDIFGFPAQFGGYAYQTVLQHLNGGSRRAGAGLCHLSEDYRKIALRELGKILDLCPSGILYDELANPFLLCCDPSHGHRMGASVDVGAQRMAEEFYKEAVSRLGDEFFFAGEGPSDVISQIYWGSYIRTGDGNMGEAIHVPAWKFMNPDMYMITCLVGFDDREMVNQCMTFGYAINYEPHNFKGRTTDVPLTAAYIRQAQALRKKLSGYIWNGEFQHTLGASVEVTGEAAEFIYSVFRNRENGKKAVVVANQDAGHILEAIVRMENGNAGFREYRPGSEETVPSDGTISIPPRSMLVLVED